MAAARGAGGTSGGIGEFFVGLALMALGVYLFLGHIVVTSNASSFFFGHTGVLLVPLALGLALLFFSGKSLVGWLLALGSIAAILVVVVSNLTLFFAPTGLWRTVGMMMLMFVGLVMVVRSLRPR